MIIKLPCLEDYISIAPKHILSIENQEVFSNIVYSLHTHDEKIICTNKQFNKFKPTDMLIITDIIGFDLNNTTVLKKLYEDIESDLNLHIETKSKIEQLANEITDILAKELIENNFNLIYDEITIQELLKSLGVKIDTHTATLLDKIFNILQVFKYYKKEKILIFINICSYFSKKEIASIIEYIQLNHLNVLIIEPRQVYDVPQHILDTDFFQYEI